MLSQMRASFYLTMWDAFFQLFLNAE